MQSLALVRPKHSVADRFHLVVTVFAPLFHSLLRLAAASEVQSLKNASPTALAMRLKVVKLFRERAPPAAMLGCAASRTRGHPSEFASAAAAHLLHDALRLLADAASSTASEIEELHTTIPDIAAQNVAQTHNAPEIPSALDVDLSR